MEKNIFDDSGHDASTFLSKNPESRTLTRDEARTIRAFSDTAINYKFGEDVLFVGCVGKDYFGKKIIEFVNKHSNQPITAYGYLYAKHLVGVRPLTVENVIIYSRHTKDPWENENDSKTNS